MDPEAAAPQKRREIELPAAPPELRRSTIDAVRRSPAPSASQVRKRELLLASAAIVLAWLLFEGFGGVRTGPRPFVLVAATAMGSALIASGATWIAGGSGRQMLGRPRVLLVATAVFVPMAYLAWKVILTAPFPNMDVEWPTRPGWRCFRLSLLLATPPFTAFFYLRKRSDPTHPRAMGAALGAAAGACSSLFVDLWCPVAYVPHLVLGHLLPMALLALLGAVVGHRLLGISVNERRDR
jgi:hypothetical protein